MAGMPSAHHTAAACTTTSLCAVAACSFTTVSAPAEAGLRLLQLTPAQDFLPSDGREMAVPAWRINAAIASAVMERFNGPRVIDYEHQTLHKEANGKPAPAAGWIKGLRWIEGQGLFAIADLTDKARAAIDAKEYLYVSPVFLFHPQTGEVLDIRMAALTNDPGIRGMQALSAMQAAATAKFSPAPSISSTPSEESMNPTLKALLAALGLPETTTEQAALSAVTTIKATAEAALSGLKLKAEDGATAVQAACSALHGQVTAAATPDPAKFVPVDALTQLQGQLAVLTAQQQADEVEKRIAPALADGRLNPVLEAWARDLGKKDMAALTAFLDKAQPIAALTGTQTGGQPPAALATGAHGLSQDEMAACTAMGLSPEDFAKTKAAA